MNNKCQVFTPENYVKELLDSVGYIENLYGKTFLENSCGGGNILLAAVQRYIDDCRKNELPAKTIELGLQRDIYGVEIDPQQYIKCIEKLNALMKSNELNEIEWNIANTDYLRWNEPTEFMFIVGNPPYITYREISPEDQVFLKNNFDSCSKGKFDYCYAFIEKSIASLSSKGKMAYLIPSSIFKTVSGLNLRNMMKPHISDIKDYTQEKVFDNALVKSAIMVLEKNRDGDTLKYVDMTLENTICIPIMQLQNKWFFTENLANGLNRFGDYFKVSHVVATLLNEAYVIDDFEVVPGGIMTNGYFIEEDIVRNTATPRSIRYNKNEVIIFPYEYTQNGLRRYAEEEFEQLFPHTVKYLSIFRSKLDERKKDNGSKWFEYGRSQALSGLNREKLLISTVITDVITVNMLDADCIPYAGMFIVQREDNDLYTLEDAINILENRRFMQYVLDVGVHISGSSLRITSKDIEDYRF